MNHQPLTIIVAIDGPSASGKSTVARHVADKLGYVYVDSGSLYRGITWKMLKEGIDAGDMDGVSGLVRDVEFDFFVNDGAVSFRICGVAPGAALREQVVNESVSPVSAIPEVRRKVVGLLRSMKDLGSLVIEGRDIGTAVFPKADYKFYLNASAEERARRRHSEMDDSAASMTVTDVKESLEKRDSIDSTREMDPLKIADDAEVIDSTTMEIEDVVARILSVVQMTDK